MTRASSRRRCAMTLHGLKMHMAHDVVRTEPMGERDRGSNLQTKNTLHRAIIWSC
jgi:hypothetical protein